jgi:hypothetical protein
MTKTIKYLLKKKFGFIPNINEYIPKPKKISINDNPYSTLLQSASYIMEHCGFMAYILQNVIIADENLSEGEASIIQAAIGVLKSINLDSIRSHAKSINIVK